jgi:hypothetical protein
MFYRTKELIKDRKRLEWMAKNAGTLLTDSKGLYVCFYDNKDLDDSINQFQTDYYRNWRDAIDEAM